MPKKISGGSDVAASNMILPSKLSTGTFDASKYETAVKGFKGGNCGAVPILKTGGKRKSKRRSSKKKSKKTVRWFW